MVSLFFQRALFMKDNGYKINPMGLVELCTILEIIIKASGNKGNAKEMDYVLIIQNNPRMMGSGATICLTVKV